MTSLPTWLADPMLQQFFAATREAGGEARVVGGAVRDFLMGIEGGDVDLASTLRPEQTMEVAAALGFKAVPTGIAHGTVTLVLPTRVIEVTTLRRDVETDGRRATVAFTDCFEEDAARRDFTFNALYMDARGMVYDYFGGQNDLAAHAVRFIGDAATRIAEDGLRMLRYFRFLATHSKPPADAAALAAISNQKMQITQLSGERIAAEMKKLLAAADPTYAVQQMAETGLAPLLTNTDWNPLHLTKMLQQEVQHTIAPMALVRLLSLIEPVARATSATWIGERWKLSRAEREVLAYLAQPHAEITAAVVKEWVRAKPRRWVEGRLLLAFTDAALPPEQAQLLAEFAQQWIAPVFPVTAGDLLARGFTQGVTLGETLRGLELQWTKSDYTLTKEALLGELE